MTRIYTKTGDRGETGLIGGARVPKDHPRVAAYGDVDELNAAVGLARALLAGDRRTAALARELARVQADLFELGAELAVGPTEEIQGRSPRTGAAEGGSVARVGKSATGALEQAIDRMTAGLPKLDRFILPGGSQAGAALHLARTVCRRAERAVVALARSSPVRPECAVYLNRLSDYLFTLARFANLKGRKPETPWIPKNR